MSRSGHLHGAEGRRPSPASLYFCDVQSRHFHLPSRWTAVVSVAPGSSSCPARDALGVVFRVRFETPPAPSGSGCFATRPAVLFTAKPAPPPAAAERATAAVAPAGDRDRLDTPLLLDSCSVSMRCWA